MSASDDPNSRSTPLRMAVLLSGQGTSLENLLDEIDAGRVPARVEVVISSKPHAFGLERARRRGIRAVAVPRKDHADVHSFNDAIHAELAKEDLDLIALLGFLSLFELRDRYEGRTINVHPSLIPAFCGQNWYGHRVHEAVLKAGVKITGATVHFLNAAYDEGPIIVQDAVPVLEGDTVDSLAARVVAVERRLVPEAIRLFAEGRIRVEGGRTVISR